MHDRHSKIILKLIISLQFLIFFPIIIIIIAGSYLATEISYVS